MDYDVLPKASLLPEEHNGTASAEPCTADGKYASSCPSSMVYSESITTSSHTCRCLGSTDLSCHASFPPIDGCVCAQGTYLDDTGKCVPSTACPCYDEGSVVPPGQVSTGCVSGCMCPSGMVSDGKGGCIKPDACSCVHNGISYQPGESTKVDCNTCTCKDRKWQCTTEACDGTCSVYGAGHYMTFDQKRFTFDGSCEYILTQDYCGSAQSNGTFRVISENLPCGTTGTTCSKTIRIFLGNAEVILTEGRYQLLSSGDEHSVPFRYSTMGIYLGRVCGLCGNYDGNANNDFTTRGNAVVVNPLVFGNSWKDLPSCPDGQSISSPCTTNPYRQAWSQKQCSLIQSDVFSACHSTVDPTPYYDACVFDSCACDTGGDSLFCDYYNPPGECEWHYMPCGSPCMKTCRNPSGSCSPQIPPLEVTAVQRPSNAFTMPKSTNYTLNAFHYSNISNTLNSFHHSTNYNTLNYFHHSNNCNTINSINNSYSLNTFEYNNYYTFYHNRNNNTSANHNWTLPCTNYTLNAFHYSNISNTLNSFHHSTNYNTLNYFHHSNNCNTINSINNSYSLNTFEYNNYYTFYHNRNNNTSANHNWTLPCTNYTLNAFHHSNFYNTLNYFHHSNNYNTLNSFHHSNNYNTLNSLHHSKNYNTLNYFNHSTNYNTLNPFHHSNDCNTINSINNSYSLNTFEYNNYYTFYHNRNNNTSANHNCTLPCSSHSTNYTLNAFHYSNICKTLNSFHHSNNYKTLNSFHHSNNYNTLNSFHHSKNYNTLYYFHHSNNCNTINSINNSYSLNTFEYNNYYTFYHNRNNNTSANHNCTLPWTYYTLKAFHHSNNYNTLNSLHHSNNYNTLNSFHHSNNYNTLNSFHHSKNYTTLNYFNHSPNYNTLYYNNCNTINSINNSYSLNTFEYNNYYTFYHNRNNNTSANHNWTLPWWT
ncbi:hypothetical protein NQZ68_023710 [Dissostichus eleginoides]|nr:hypothetical protein NQZ68_023710 [Dissostichus eleginoides]